MKSILYVGATLMIGASIYGFVDYQRSSRKKEFTNMYKEKKVNEPESVTDLKTADPAADKKNIAVVTPAVNDEKKTVTEGKENEKTSPAVTPVKDGSTTKVVIRKKRRFSTNLFSRAPLDERYIDKQVKLEEPKTKTAPIVIGTSKTENKEQ